MPIKSLSRDELIAIKLNKARKELKLIERELMDQLKDSMKALLDLESLYELKEHIDELILNWEDKDINLDDYGGGSG